jgi:molybdopterin/thiamine biosynthesis adenylyltransferase
MLAGENVPRPRSSTRERLLASERAVERPVLALGPLPRDRRGGQRRIGAFSIAFVGVGAVGAAAAEEAARAGFGRLTLIDRDVVEPSNLTRQLLFDADDAERVAPKAEAGAARLLEIDPSLAVKPVVADFDAGNARELLAGHDLVFDGSDNRDLPSSRTRRGRSACRTCTPRASVRRDASR